MTETKFILVVEDDPILKNLLGHTLAGKYQTLYASDGNEALALFEQNKPALVLLDLMLPTMDGFAVLETIRKRTDELAQTPVIVVSNLGQQKDIDRAKTLGANDYLIKAEVSIEEIVTKMESVLGVSIAAAPVMPEVAPVAAAMPAPVEAVPVAAPVPVEIPPAAPVAQIPAAAAPVAPAVVEVAPQIAPAPLASQPEVLPMPEALPPQPPAPPIT